MMWTAGFSVSLQGRKISCNLPPSLNFGKAISMAEPVNGVWYVYKTLLSNNNRRMIRQYPDEKIEIVMNQNMGVWTPDHDRVLKIIVDALNSANMKGRDDDGEVWGLPIFCPQRQMRLVRQRRRKAQRSSICPCAVLGLVRLLQRQRTSPRERHERVRRPGYRAAGSKDDL